MKSLSIHLILFIAGTVLATDSLLAIKTAESVGSTVGYAVMGITLIITTIIFGYVHDKSNPLYTNSTSEQKDSILFMSNVSDFMFFFILAIGNKIALYNDSTVQTVGIIAGMIFIIIPIKISVERNIEKQLKGEQDGNNQADNNADTDSDTSI